MFTHQPFLVLSQDDAVVGVDMEWQPTFGCSSAQQVALIQLAVQDHVFLLDLCASDFCHHPDTISFVRSLFSQNNVLKLGKLSVTNDTTTVLLENVQSLFCSLNVGYGMTGDLKCLLTTWPQLSEEPLKMEGVLDLLRVHQKVQESDYSNKQYIYSVFGSHSINTFRNVFQKNRCKISDETVWTHGLPLGNI